MTLSTTLSTTLPITLSMTLPATLATILPILQVENGQWLLISLLITPLAFPKVPQDPSYDSQPIEHTATFKSISSDI